MPPSSLKPTTWLAKRLGVSVTTVERLRAAGSTDLPPCVTIGGSIRYDEAHVEQWLVDRMNAPAAQAPVDQHGGDDERAN